MTTSTTAVPTCYRHADRESHIRCTRCLRPICPDCMREASVGFQCPECVRDGNRGVRQARTVFGARAAGAGTPWVTLTLILLNFAAYAGELQRKTFQGAFAMIGAGLAGPDGQLYSGIPSVPPGFHQVGVSHGEWYRLVTANFVHAMPTGSSFGIAHILFNMFALWQLGPALERQLGRERFAAVYLLCGFGGSVAVYLLAPQQETFGASGAVFGLVAVYFVLGRKHTIDLPGGQQMLVYYLVWLVASMRVTSWQGHLGGLVTGLVLGAVIAAAPRARQRAVHAAGIAAVFVILVAVVAVRAATWSTPSTMPTPTASAPSTAPCSELRTQCPSAMAISLTTTSTVATAR